jgi:hypothetical protein
MNRRNFIASILAAFASPFAVKASLAFPRKQRKIQDLFRGDWERARSEIAALAWKCSDKFQVPVECGKWMVSTDFAPRQHSLLLVFFDAWNCRLGKVATVVVPVDMREYATDESDVSRKITSRFEDQSPRMCGLYDVTPLPNGVTS